MGREYKAMSYKEAHKWEPLAKKRGVSKVARSSRGFMRAYEKAGTFSKLPEKWKAKRRGFIARHMAQAKDEDLWKNGKPSNRALALIMWAYMPPGKGRNNPYLNDYSPSYSRDIMAKNLRAVQRLYPEVTDRLGSHTIKLHRKGRHLVWVVSEQRTPVASGRVDLDTNTTINAAVSETRQGKGVYKKVLWYLRDLLGVVKSPSILSSGAHKAWQRAGARLANNQFVLRSNPPQRIAVDLSWVDRAISQWAPEIGSYDEEDIVAMGEFGGVKVYIYEPYGDGSLVWAAFDRGNIVGAGSFDFTGSALVARIQALQPAYQRKGIYRWVIQAVREAFPVYAVESDSQQTEGASALWKKLGATDAGDYYVLPPLE